MTIFGQCPAKIITKYIGTPPYGHLSVIRSTFLLNSSVSVEDVSRYFSLLISADVWYRRKHSLRLTSFSIVTRNDRGVFASLIHARFASSCLNIKTIWLKNDTCRAFFFFKNTIIIMWGNELSMGIDMSRIDLVSKNLLANVFCNCRKRNNWEKIMSENH